MSDIDADVVIVGGGSAGCVLAARLSERADRRVILIEAGDDILPGAVPATIRSRYPGRAYFDPRWGWPPLPALLGEAQRNDDAARPRVRYEQARVMGGGSSINGIGGNRGAPSDYDEWAARGLDGWSWRDVAPYFRKLERDLDCAGSNHGRDGPLPIRRVPRAVWSRFTHAVVAAAEAAGIVPREDQNGAWLDGVMPATVTLDENWERASTATSYLDAAVRARRNLRILPRTQARAIRFDGTRATGAVIRDAEGERVLCARDVIVSCGALHTPALLMRSGVGPASDLQRLGIAVVADRAGIGLNLMDHPATSVSCLLRRNARGGRDDYHIPAIIRFSSGLEGCPQGDMHLAIAQRSAWHSLGQRIGSLTFWVNKAHSTGYVRLVAPDPATPPMIDFRLLADERDRVRMRSGFRFAASLMLSRELADVRRVAFPAFYSERVRRITRPGMANAFRLGALSLLGDLAGATGARFVAELASSGQRLDRLLADDQELDAYLQRAVVGVWHASGTCRMGGDGDPLAVTNSRGAVRGVACLHVCDTSLMPTIPCANLNLPVIMIAEKIAAEFDRNS
jgi:5-(hydroxymethyl)furfural/furfural oxidase